MRSYRVMVQSDVVVVVMVELDWKDGLVVASCYYIYIYKICIFVFWVRLVVVVVVVVVVWHSQLGVVLVRVVVVVFRWLVGASSLH